MALPLARHRPAMPLPDHSERERNIAVWRRAERRTRGGVVVPQRLDLNVFGPAVGCSGNPLSAPHGSGDGPRRFGGCPTLRAYDDHLSAGRATELEAPGAFFVCGRLGGERYACALGADQRVKTLGAITGGAQRFHETVSHDCPVCLARLRLRRLHLCGGGRTKSHADNDNQQSRYYKKRCSCRS
jgi:hypothetical protein